jgi:hypothetical protein
MRVALPAHLQSRPEWHDKAGTAASDCAAAPYVDNAFVDHPVSALRLDGFAGESYLVSVELGDPGAVGRNGYLKAGGGSREVEEDRIGWMRLKAVWVPVGV